MKNKSLLHDAGSAIVRTPLLWFFTTIYCLTLDLPTIVQNRPSWFIFLYILTMPIIILAPACQIRAIQLQYFSAAESVLQIIRFCARRIGALFVVLLFSGVLALLLLGIIGCPLSLFLEQETKSKMWTSLYDLANIIALPIMVFAQCAIVISGLPVKSSILMLFKVIKKDPFPMLTLIVILAVLRYIMVTIYPTVVTNPIRISGYLLILLILESAQAAFFTIAYLHYLLKATATHQPAISS